MGGEQPRRSCPKCESQAIETRGIRTTGSGLSRWFNYQRNKFIVVSCQHCGYSEFYYDDGREERAVVALFGQEHSSDDHTTATGAQPDFRHEVRQFWEAEGWEPSEHEPSDGLVLFSGTRNGELGEQTGLLLAVTDETRAVTDSLVTDLETQRRNRDVDVAAITAVGEYTGDARRQIEQYGIRQLSTAEIRAATSDTAPTGEATTRGGIAAGGGRSDSTPPAEPTATEQPVADDSGGLLTRRRLLLLALLPATWVGTYAYSQTQSNDSGGFQANDGGEQIDMQVGRGSTRATSEAVIVEVPVENSGSARGTVEFRTTLFLDGDQHSANQHTVTLAGGESRTVESSHGVGRLESFTAETYRHSVDVIDEYSA